MRRYLFTGVCLCVASLATAVAWQYQAHSNASEPIGDDSVDSRESLEAPLATDTRDLKESSADESVAAVVGDSSEAKVPPESTPTKEHLLVQADLSEARVAGQAHTMGGTKPNIQNDRVLTDGERAEIRKSRVSGLD